jgi:hypothetical protein
MRPVWKLMGWEVSPVFSKRELFSKSEKHQKLMVHSRLNPGPPQPQAGIIPLDQVDTYSVDTHLYFNIATLFMEELLTVTVI